MNDPSQCELQAELDALLDEAALSSGDGEMGEMNLSVSDPQAEECISLTLRELDIARRPQAKTVCETCPNSIWFTSPSEVKCYCRVMFLITWSSSNPGQITGCDGWHLSQDR